MEGIYAQYNRLIAAVSALPEVLSIGKSGGVELPQPGESDIDLFVFCEAVPNEAERRRWVESLGDGVTGCRIGEIPSRHWGTRDYVYLGDAEICLMYFPIREMNAEIDAVLGGARLEKEDNYFYPTGRCASFLSMHILYDRGGYIASTKERLRAYPKDLMEKLTAHHLRGVGRHRGPGTRRFQARRIFLPLRVRPGAGSFSAGAVCDERVLLSEQKTDRPIPGGLSGKT
jgi:hypothetical protein